MKRKTIIHASIAGTAMAFMVAGTIAGISLFEKKAEKADAYSTQSSCPTTIDLNDTSAANIRSYYSSLNNLSTSERQGTNLLKNLKPILKNGQKYWNYDSGNTVWQMYEIIDRDWEKSPKTAISGYNASTNKITGYSYGTSTSSVGTNPYVHALYVNRNVANQTTAWSDHSQTNWGINREHIWAKSHGFDDGGSGGARGDPMHLWAGNGYANNIHSNNFFGFVNTSSSYKDCGSKYSYVSGNLSGSALNASGTVFEPQDSDKGDIARAIFYMVARYNYYSGSDSDGIDSSNPNLQLLDAATDPNGTTAYESSTTKAANMGVMRDLLAWNRLDPPDEWEIHRNNLVYTNFSNNRNPFIDFPEWAEYIWGKPTLASNNRNITSFSTNPTGYAIPSSDSLNTFGNAVTTPTITLNKTSATLAVNGTVQLTATAMGGSGNVTWTTSNSSRAQLSATSGNTVTVTGKQAGTATITATYSGKTATCSITVSATAPTVSSVTINPATVTLDLNGTTTADLTATVTGTNSPAQTVTWSSNKTNIATVSSAGKVTAVAVGSATITATSTVDDTKYGTCTVTVTNSGGTSTPAGTFTVSLKDNSLSSATSYQYETTTNDYNGGDATASLYWGGLNAKQGNIKGNGDTQSNLQSGNAKNFYIHNTTPLPGPVTSIRITGLTKTDKNYATAASAYACTGATTISNQTTTGSVAGTASTDGTEVSWTFDESTSGKYFAVGAVKGFTTGTVQATSFIIDYAATSGGSSTPTIDSVTVTPSFMQLTAGETKGLTCTVAGENNPDTSVSWTSNNTSVATVDSDGNVTAKATGTATITAKSTFDTTKSGSATISVVSPSAVSGSPYMNGVPYKMFAVKSGTTTNYYFNGGMSGYYGGSSTSMSASVDMWFEANGSGQNMYFVTSGGEKQYVTAVVNGNYVNFTIGTTAGTAWLYDSTTGGLYTVNNSTNYYLGFSGTYTTFGNYTASNVTGHIQFIAVTEAAQIGLATIIINNVVCNANGTTAPTLSSLAAWSQLGDMFSKLDSTLQQGLTDMDADEDGTIIQRAMAKYDYILGKYGTGTYSNFLNRTVINNSNKLGKTVVTNNTMLLLVVIAALGTFTFAAWFIHKKKQYDL